MRTNKSFLPVLPWTGDHFGAAQMRFVFPSASAFLQTTVIFLGHLPGKHFKGHKTHGIRLLAREPQQISPSWDQTSASVQPTVPTKQPVKCCWVLEMPMEETAICVMMGIGENLQAPGSLETHL